MTEVKIDLVTPFTSPKLPPFQVAFVLVLPENRQVPGQGKPSFFSPDPRNFESPLFNPFHESVSSSPRFLHRIKFTFRPRFRANTRHLGSSNPIFGSTARFSRGNPTKDSLSRRPEHETRQREPKAIASAERFSICMRQIRLILPQRTGQERKALISWDGFFLT